MNIYKIFSLFGFIFLYFIAQANANDQIVIQEKIGRGSFTPEIPPFVNYQDNELILEPIYTTDQITVLIKDRESTSQIKQLPDRQVKLPDEMAQLSEIRPIYGNKVVAIGLANSAVSVIAIIDRKTGVIIDTFYGYKPTISPNGYWIAFQEFFPSHSEEDIRSCYRIYDVSHNASRNRHAQADVSDPQWVGFSIYPLRTRSQQIECGATNKDGEFLMASDTFVWGEKSDQFIFSTSNGNALNLVLVKLSGRSKQWQTFIYDLNKDKHTCLATSCDSAKVTSLELEEDIAIMQVFSGTLGEKPSNLSIPIKNFIPIKP